MTINDVGYELNTATASDAEVEFAIHPDKITHTSDRHNHQNYWVPRQSRFVMKISLFWRLQWARRLAQTINRPCSSVREFCRRHRRSSRLWCNKLSRTWLWTGQDQKWLHRKVAGLVWTERPHLSGGFLKPVIPHPLVVSGALGLSINGSLLPQIFVSMMNWELPLIEVYLVIKLRRPLSSKYSGINYPTVPSGISMHAVGCTSR